MVNISPNKWLIFCSIGVMILLINLDATIVNLALANIAKAFNINMVNIQWIVSSYLLTTAATFTVFGRLADIYGRKKLFLIGATLFSLSSLAIGLSPNFICLITFRALQGLGFAASLGVSVILISNAFPAHQKGMVTGFAMMITGVAQSIGPTIGGMILSHLSWPWIFFINVPLGAISVISCYFLVPAEKTSNNLSSKINWLNAGLLMAGLSLIIYSLNEIASLHATLLISLLVTGTLLLYTFYHTTKHSKAPLVDISLLHNKHFTLLLLCRGLFMIYFAVFLFSMPLFLQNVSGYSPLQAGLILLSMTVLIIIASPLAGRWIDKSGYCTPLIGSFIVATAGCALTLTLTPTSSIHWICITLSLFGIAAGLHLPSSTQGALSSTCSRAHGTAMGLFFTIATACVSLGVALSGILMNKVSCHVISSKEGFSALTLPTQKALLRVSSGAANIGDITTHISKSLHISSQAAYMQAFHLTLNVTAILMLAGLATATYMIISGKKTP